MAASAAAAEPDGRSPETVDRILVGVCGAIWLVLLAVTGIATVALVGMGRGHRGGDSGHSSWVLYSIIIVSAAIIVGAIPLLLRARRAAMAVEAPPAELPASPVRPIEARGEKVRVFGTAVDPYARSLPVSSAAVSEVSNPVVERLWLRGTVSLLAATGLALIGVAIATYLLAQSSLTAAWVALGFAGVITVAMPAILVFFQRELGQTIDEAAT